MKLPLFISSILLTLLISFSPSLASIESTCKAAAESSPNVNYDFCVTSLQADGRSRDADAKGLAEISTMLGSANATSTKDKISDLLNKVRDRPTHECLDTCSSLYSDLIENLKESLDAIKQERYADAKINLSGAMTDAETCEDTFEEKNLKSLVKKEDEDAQGLAAIALAITSSLK